MPKKYEEFMFQADLVCGRQEGVMKEGLRRAEKVVLSGAIARVQSEKSFFVQDEKYGKGGGFYVERLVSRCPTFLGKAKTTATVGQTIRFQKDTQKDTN